MSLREPRGEPPGADTPGRERRGNTPRSLLGLIMTILMTCGPVQMVFAQFGGIFGAKKNDGVTIDKVEFGFGGLVPIEQWTPMTVWLTGGPKGFSGAMIVEYAQDATQSARIITPAGATPGVSAPVQVTVCLPGNLSSLTIELVGQDGRSKGVRKLSTFGAPDEGVLTYEPCDGQALIGVVGSSSALRAFRARGDMSRPAPSGGYYPGDGVSREYRSAEIEPELLPTNWSAYAGISSLVVASESLRGVNASAVRAVRTWVRGGGRLVVQVPVAGDGWRAWVGEDACPFFELDDSARHDTPAALATAVRVAGVGVPVADDANGKGTSGAPYSFNGRPAGFPFTIASPAPTLERPTGFDPQPAPRVPGRAVRLTPEGVAQGWQVRWPVGSSEDSEAVGLIGEGPVGMGWVTVVGVEPQATSQIIATPVAASVWAEALRFAAQGSRATVRSNQSNTWEQSSSAPDRESRVALRKILDSLSTVPPIGVGVFVGILACLVILAFLVGPVDALVLRMLKLQHFAWLSAVLWILVASLGAYLIPSYHRSARTQVNHASITDVLMDRPGDYRVRGMVWTSGVTGIFAGRRGEFVLRSANDSAWWRGLSAITQFEVLTPRGFPPMQTVQRPGLIAGDPGSAPESLWLGQWTFRTMQSDGPSGAGPRAIITRDADRWSVAVSGLPANAKVGAARLLFADRMVSFDGRRNPTTEKGGWTATSSPAEFPDIERASKGGSFAEFAAAAYGDDPAFLTTGLPGPAGRSVAIVQRIASGRWAMLALSVAGGPHDPDFGDDADYGQARVFRLLIPLGPEESVCPVTLPIPPMPDFPRVPALPNRVPKSLGMPTNHDADGPSDEGPPGDSPVDPNEMIERESPDPAGHETSAENDRPNTIQMERTS